ncbi:ABC transporter permease [Ahrensia sp. R2A130]|uniref:ABC transporter permease n=1 Tax=Ahrensia sp. R2A130 TaxID=744979 RepID=UPI0001E0D136|nr:ABC transporter permease [Ahrensia sp. R2A130]EFL87912.1 binding-protein-dependent transport systems inner membrane component [Ahrensia sp. R2A130]
MLSFLLRRSGVMLLTALCLTFVVFFLVNLDPNLEKLAKSEGNQRMTDAQVESWLDRNGYRQPLVKRYGEWLGVMPGWTRTTDEGATAGRCIGRTPVPAEQAEQAASYCGLLQGNWGFSTVFKEPVGGIVLNKLGLTGKLMFFVLLVMVPSALVIGVIAGMREGSKTDRTLSTFSILTTSTPEYVSGVILIVVFASRLTGLRWFNGTAASAMENATFSNFTLPVIALALYGMGYIARMTRASMAEVMQEQYIRTARLKGLGFYSVVLKHALRNALIAPFTVIMLQIPWLLTGVVIIETLFNYKGFGWTLVQAVGNNDIETMMAVSVVAVFVVLITQLISDIGYVFLNPRIRVS